MIDALLPHNRWSDFSRLLDEALELPDAARADWLVTQASRDPEAGAWLRRVLGHASAATAPEYLERPRIDRAPDEDVQSGATIGNYRLLREIGTGGMGVVWLAQRSDGQLDRDVALKLPHVHLLAGAVRERFARERNILARLNHPHIATLYDAGLAASGRPYLALEYVDGVPITQWCRERRAGIEQRLALMLQVMDAVEYAHARLVVHRDLKPSNVLVTAGGDVKLLDFGIAKLLATDDLPSEGSTLTRMGHRMATPGYSAPEQIAGLTVTTRADVYALGVMLYELLCGRRPFADAPAPAAEPPRCSTQVDPEFSATVGGSDPATLRRALRGDLDAILAKAIDPSPENRYGSVEAFAADVQRYRVHEPILAQRIGRLSLAAKFVRRHRLGTAFAAVLLIAIAIGVTVVAWEANEAAQQARRAEAAKAFLVDIFSASDPRIASDKPRGEITARELLDLGATRIEREFADDPPTQIDLLGTVADIYRELGVADRSAALNARKIELAKKTYGELSEPVLNDAVQQASYACTDQSDRCADLLREADALLNRAGRNDSTLRADWWVAEGQRLRAEQGKDAERRAALEKGASIYRDSRATQYRLRDRDRGTCDRPSDARRFPGLDRAAQAGAGSRRRSARAQRCGTADHLRQSRAGLSADGRPGERRRDVFQGRGRRRADQWPGLRHVLGHRGECCAHFASCGRARTRRCAVRKADAATAPAVAAFDKRQHCPRSLRRTTCRGGPRGTGCAAAGDCRARPDRPSARRFRLALGALSPGRCAGPDRPGGGGTCHVVQSARRLHCPFEARSSSHCSPSASAGDVSCSITAMLPALRSNSTRSFVRRTSAGFPTLRSRMAISPASR